MTQAPNSPHAAGIAALVRPACEAGLRRTTEIEDDYPRERIVLCGQVVGVSGYLAASGLRHWHCALPGHHDNVHRRFPADAWPDAGHHEDDGPEGEPRFDDDLRRAG